jgi:class 3 adenylate cyclase
VKATAEPVEERKVATVLFADLAGSTALADAEDPERTRALLDRFSDAMAVEIERAGGTVEKFVGDAVMAAFGAPVALEDHAERALHAALAMQQRLGELFDGRLSLRIGVNTGEVVAGRAREGGSFVSGDAVNTGARLEQAAGGGEVLVGERTVAAVRGAFEFGEVVAVAAKGKPGGVPARRLVRPMSLMRPRGVSGLRPAFVGRDPELSMLCGAFRDVCDAGDPRLVVLLGEAGVGKTRLVREFWAWLGDQSPNPVRLAGRCLSYGNATAYWPLAEVLREQFDLREDEAPETVLARLGKRRVLARTLGVDTGEDLHPLVARERLHDGWAAFLAELAAERPAVVLVEDMHWADDELLDLVEALLGQVRGPLLILATARPELGDRRPSFGIGSSRRRVVLEALAAGDAGELLSRLLGQEPPTGVRDAVIGRCEGNPFFVEELLATLIDRGVLVRDEDGVWACGELPEGFEVPDTVQAVLAGRIDLLPDAEKAALQAGAVIGRVFWTRPVYHLLGGVAPDFRLLEERDFVRRRPSSALAGEREYAIKHALTREVAYASLPKARRAQLHAGFARWLEEASGAADDQAALLAHHYAQAVRPEDADLAWSGEEQEASRLREKASAWARRAAAIAISRYEMDAGVALLRQAVELESDPARQAAMWLAIAQAHAIRYDGAAFTAAMERALELGADEGATYAELVYQAAQRGAMWNPPIDDKLEVWAERALAATQPRSLERGKALAGAAGVRNAPDIARQALAIADDLDDDDLRTGALFILVHASEAVGEFNSMLAAVERNVALLPHVSDPDRRANILITAVVHPVYLGQFTLPLRTIDLLDETTAGLTAHHRMHAAGARIGLAWDMGRWEHICELTPRAETVVDGNAETPCVMNQTTLLFCAVAHQIMGRPKESKRLEDKAEALNLQGYDQAFDPTRLLLAVNRGDLDRVEALITRIEQSAVQDNWTRISILDGWLALGAHERIKDTAPEWLMPGTYFEPFVARALGAAKRDDRLIEQAIIRFQEMGLEWHADQTRALRGRRPSVRADPDGGLS